MPSVDAILQRFCLAVLILSVGLVGVVLLHFAWNAIGMEQFYGARPILQAMRDARDARHESSIVSTGAGEALLKYLPMGTDSASASKALSGEGFSCRKEAEAFGEQMECRLRVSGPFGYTYWSIDLRFDNSDQLVEARVTSLNISL